MSAGVIRKAATSGDYSRIRGLFREYGEALATSLDAGICVEGFDQEIASLPGSYETILYAEAEGKPLGCVALRPARVSEASEMKRLFVRPAARGRGLGRELILAAMSCAHDKGYQWLYLDTVPFSMPVAQRLYLSLGFEPVMRFNDNPVPNIVFLRRRLTSD